MLGRCKYHGVTEFAEPNQNGEKYCLRCRDEGVNALFIEAVESEKKQSLGSRELTAALMQEVYDWLRTGHERYMAIWRPKAPGEE